MYKNSVKRMLDKQNINAAYAAIAMPKGFKMKVSSIFANPTARIETKTDALMELTSEDSKNRFIMMYGDQVVKYDHDCKVYRVPAFANEIAEYKKAKLESCKRYGSN